MQISWSGKRNNGGTLMQFGPVFSKKERKSRYKSNFQRVSLRKQVCLWICRAMFLQRVFQFGFLNTVETLSFFSLKSSSEFVLHCEKFISFLASPPIYRSKFQLCNTAWSIIIFMRTALSCLCFFFLNQAAEIMLNMLFNTLLTITPHNTQKRSRRKERITYGPLRRYSQLVTHLLNPD